MVLFSGEKEERNEGPLGEYLYKRLVEYLKPQDTVHIVKRCTRRFFFFYNSDNDSDF